MRLVNLKGEDKLVSVEVVSGRDLERFATEGEVASDEALSDVEMAAGGATDEGAPADDSKESSDPAGDDEATGDE